MIMIIFLELWNTFSRMLSESGLLFSCKFTIASRLVSGQVVSGSVCKWPVFVGSLRQWAEGWWTVVLKKPF